MNARDVGLAGAIVGLIATLATAQEPKREDRTVTVTIVHPPIGKPAPAIAVGKWIKGEPVARFEPGRVYVVAFWNSTRSATRKGLLQLSKLHDEHPDVPFLAVSVFEKDPAAVAPFVRSLGEDLNLSVALDDVPPGADASTGAMATGWLNSDEDMTLIPYVNIVKDGRIAEVGLPDSLGADLTRVLSPDFDVDKVAAERRANRGRDPLLGALASLRKLQAAWAKKDFDAAAAIIDEEIADNPLGGALILGTQHVEKLLGAGREAEAAAYLTRIADRERTVVPQAPPLAAEALNRRAAGALNHLVSTIVDPKRPQPAGPELRRAALAAAKRADELAGGKDGAVLDTLARAYFVNGEAVKALETQRKALDATEEPNQEMRDRLEEYRRAAGE